MFEYEREYGNRVAIVIPLASGEVTKEQVLPPEYIGIH